MMNSNEFLQAAFYLSGILFFLSNNKFPNSLSAGIVIGLIIINAILKR